ncbi:hypothetical protein [Mucilaginibacter gracilis]|nr:hypothetical protein [Mucilaginibacter gracilis]
MNKTLTNTFGYIDMSNKTLIILASARRESNTEKFVKEIYGDNNYQLINP